jgi:hypothetical protein
MPNQANPKYFVAYVIDFSDGGEPEYQILQSSVESIERCEEIARLSLAVIYSGGRPVKEARIVWAKESTELPSHA